MIINKAIDHKAKYNHNIIDAVYKIFHMGYYLVLYRNIDSANVSVVDIKKIVIRRRIQTNQVNISPQSEIAKSSREDNSMRNETKKILGITWNYKKDTLNVRYSNKSNPNTIRDILSHISSIFNPLGFLVPFLLEPKLTTQQPWKEKTELHEKILEILNKRWIKWTQLQEQQDLVKIP